MDAELEKAEERASMSTAAYNFRARLSIGSAMHGPLEVLVDLGSKISKVQSINSLLTSTPRRLDGPIRTMTSEMRLASRRLLHASALPLAPRALPRLLAFPQIRAISTTVPREAVSRPSWASRTGPRANPFDSAPKAEKKPAAPAAAPEPVPEVSPPHTEVKAAAAPVPTPSPLSDISPFSKAIPTAASRSASSDYLYDATSAKTIDISQIIKDDSDAFHAQHYGKPQAELRLHPVLGRTTHVNSRVDVAMAVNYTNALTARNKIKFHYHHQRFHERPGLKRKRLRSERWRTKFKKGFAATVHRVQDLKAQGW